MQVSDGWVVRDPEPTPSLEGAESRGRCWAMHPYPYLTKETGGQANLTRTARSLSSQYVPFIIKSFSSLLYAPVRSLFMNP